MHRDTVVGLVGAVLLVAALVGIFFYEARNAPATDTGAFATVAEEGPGVQGDPIGEGATGEHDLEIDAQGLAAIDFVVVWNDDNGDPDVFQVRVLGPGGVSRTSETEDDGEIRVRFEGLNASPSGTNGTGVWHVTVELVDAIGTTTPLGEAPVQQDGGNAYAVQTDLELLRPA